MSTHPLGGGKYPLVRGDPLAGSCVEDITRKHSSSGPCLILKINHSMFLHDPLEQLPAM
jgi:hypothetical protein